MYDLIVIGGGPAGTAAAIVAARAGGDVLLLESGDYPRHKVCGEFISAEALGLLTELLGDFLPLNTCQRIPRARIFIEGEVLESAIDPPAASLSRFDLDSALWSAAACAGVETRLQTLVLALEGGGPFRVSTSTDKFVARSVINASGRWSRLNSSPVPKQAALGMKAHFLEENTPSTVDLYFFPGGYCGVSPVTSSELRGRPVLNVSTLVRKTGTASLAEVLTRNAALRQRSRSWRAISDTVTTYPLLFRPPHPVAGRVLLAGDAAGFIDPFAGDGIALALRTGAMAADALAPFWSGERTLSGAVDEYRRGYEMNVASLFRSSARIRRLITLPRLVRWPLAKLVRFTRWTPHLVAGTRMRPAPAPKHKSAA